MSGYPNLAAKLYNEPLLITPDKATIIEGVFRAYSEGRAAELPPVETSERIDLAAAMSMRRAEGGYYLTNSGVAVVQVHGSLVQRGGMLESASGMTGYNRLGTMITAAFRDPSVRGVVLEIDSPGGEVAGLLDLSAMVAGADKPVYAHANELAASAAYWLASSADQVFAPKTGMLGSIGVVMLHADRSRQNERAGVSYTPIFAGARKLDGSSMAPLSEEARASAQARVDEIYSMFVSHVADARGITEQAVRDTEAGVFSTQEAVRLGLADDVATLGETIQAMTDDLNSGRLSKSSYGRAAANAQHQQEQMTMTEKTTAAPNPNAAATEAQLAAARAEGIAEGKTQATTEQAAAATAEAEKNSAAATKARIKAIETCAEAKDRPAFAKHLAFETEMSVDEARALLSAAAKETPTNPLAANMPKNPRIGADADDTTDAGAKANIDTAGIYSRMQTGRGLVAVK
jgi:capsid assembly protease